MYSPIGLLICHDVNELRKMYLLLHAGLQSVVARVSALPPAFVSMKMSLAESTTFRIAYAIGVATIPSMTSTWSWSMNFCVFWSPTWGSFASSS